MDGITKGPFLGHFIWLLLGLLSLLPEAGEDGGGAVRGWGAGWPGSWEKARMRAQH